MLVSELKESTYDHRPYPQIIDLLIEKGADINLSNKIGFSALIFAATEGNINVVERLLKEEKIKVDAKNTFGKTAFFNACEFGHCNCVKALYDSKKADINSPSKRGVTPIMLAAVKKREDIVRFLIEQGADLKVALPIDKGGDNVSLQCCLYSLFFHL